VNHCSTTEVCTLPEPVMIGWQVAKMNGVGKNHQCSRLDACCFFFDVLVCVAVRCLMGWFSASCHRFEHGKPITQSIYAVDFVFYRGLTTHVWIFA
jgi:hypothetical protein